MAEVAVVVYFAVEVVMEEEEVVTFVVDIFLVVEVEGAFHEKDVEPWVAMGEDSWVAMGEDFWVAKDEV